MASDILQRRHAASLEQEAESPKLTGVVADMLRPFASLKLTVALMAMAIFLILAGTLAQIDKDIWQVMAEYFRTPLARHRSARLFPRSWNLPAITFPFPGGFTIGGAMLINLLAAHTLRFKIQARGARLLAGLAVVAAGAGMTWVVVASGSSSGGLQDAPLLEWSTLWTALKASLGVLWLATLYALVKIDPRAAANAPAWRSSPPAWERSLPGSTCAVTSSWGPLRYASCGSCSKGAWPASFSWPVACCCFASGPASFCCTAALP